METVVLGALERFLNAQLAASTPARERTAALAGRRLGFVVVGPDIEFVLYADATSLKVTREPATSADATLSGTPLALLEAWRRGKPALLGGQSVVVTGDVQVLEQFVDLLGLATPDLEEAVAAVTGDVVAHEAFKVAFAVRAWGSRALDALAKNAGEYLQEERRELPARREIEAFAGDLEELRDGVERALARIERLAARGRDTTAAAGPSSSDDA